MHVCFFNRSYWPDVGATGQLLTELAEDLVRAHGWEVTVVTGYPLRAESRPPARERRNGVSILRCLGTTLDPRGFAGRAANYVTYFASAIVAGFGVGKPDVVVAMTDPPIIGLAGLAVSTWNGVPFVFLCEDVFPEVGVLVEDFQSGTVNAALTAVNRLLVRHAAAIIALGDTMKRRLVAGKGADPGKISVIHNWADCEAIQPAPRDNRFARTYQLVDRFVVLHAGNIGLSQNLDMVVSAAATLRDRKDIAFVFVGDGATRAALQERAAAERLDNVLFLPYQPREAMAESYGTADIALVSLRRGLAGVIVPSKMYTVLASGRGCIAAVEDDCEVADIVRNSQCGVLIEPGDAAALAARVVELEADRARVADMGARARTAALQFDRRRQVASYDALLRRVARC